MTKKTGRSAENDPSLSSLINASCSAICVVGKAWDFHVKTALEIKNEENLENIREQLNILSKAEKNFYLMQNIFLMVLNQIQSMHLTV